MTSKEQVYENLRSNGLEPELVQALVDLAISEDLMGGTDVTSLATIPEIQISELDLVTRSPGVIAGINIAALVFLSVANKKIEIFDEYVDRGQDSFLSFIRQLGGIVDEDDIKVEQIKKNFRNFVAKYENNPLGFFKAEIDKFHRVSDQVIRKIGKLYDMAQDDTQVTESIIDWELHMKLQQKKHGNRPLDTEYKYKKI